MLSFGSRFLNLPSDIEARLNDNARFKEKVLHNQKAMGVEILFRPHRDTVEIQTKGTLQGMMIVDGALLATLHDVLKDHPFQYERSRGPSKGYGRSHRKETGSQ